MEFYLDSAGLGASKYIACAQSHARNHTWASCMQSMSHVLTQMLTNLG